MKIGIVGAGHAGVEAASAVRQAGAEVALFSAESVVPYYRPRLVALAFGRVDFPEIRLHPEDWYARQGIDLILNSRVEAVNVKTREIVSGGRVFPFDGILLATGAAPVVPAFAALSERGVFALWNVEDANAVRERVKPGGRLAVVGGGILGIEIALRAAEAGMTASIVELMPRLMASHFGERASAALHDRLAEKGVSVILGRGTKAARPTDDRGAIVELEDGRTIEADICLVSVGGLPEKSLAVSAGIAADRGVIVSPCLQTSAPGIFAAGDLVQLSGVTRCSMREAINQGKVAGANVAAASVFGETRTYAPQISQVMFKSGDFELYSVGVPGGEGCEERALEGSSMLVVRSLITKDGVPVGVQMVGTREGFDECVEEIKRANRGGL